MNTIPDAWLYMKNSSASINKWQNEYKRVNIGGISCDHSDYYNSEDFNQEVLFLFSEDDKNLYLGFFHTGAYQDSLSGYGGKSILIPAPKHIIIDRDEKEFCGLCISKRKSVEEMFHFWD